jgi:hypothetical protein
MPECTAPVQARAHYERAGRLSREQLDPAGEAEALLGAAAATAELGDPAAAVEMLMQVWTMLCPLP